jgi:hypothetical protein
LFGNQRVSLGWNGGRSFRGPKLTLSCSAQAKGKKIYTGNLMLRCILGSISPKKVQHKLKNKEKKKKRIEGEKGDGKEGEYIEGEVEIKKLV